MKTFNVIRVASALAALATAALPAAAQQYTELEVNNPCTSAQYIGMPPSLPMAVTGELTPTFSDPPGDVDFFVIQATEGMRLRAGLRGDDTQPFPLANPYLGLFDINCNLLAANDNYLGLNSRLTFDVPAGSDGQFILAVTGCCDGSFEGWHDQSGAYRLRVSIAPDPVQAITGRLVDAVTGAPLPGNVEPYPMVELAYCLSGECYYFVGYTAPDEFGVFSFTMNAYGEPLDPGQYVLRAYAGEYVPVEYGPFVAAAGTLVDLGDIAMQPPPYVFENIVACADVPASGGRCRYSVDVRNNTDQDVKGMGWSLVNAYGATSPLGFSTFPADNTRNAQVEALSTRTLSFSFDVPAGVADGTFMCADAWFSDRETAYFGTLRNGALFCIMKQPNAFAVVSGKAAAAVLGIDVAASGGRRWSRSGNDH